MKFENDANQDRTEDFVTDSISESNEIVLPAQDNVITLPPGASLEDLSVEGRDLVITLADGSRIVIPDGAVFVPQIVVEGVAVPPQTVAQLLTGSEPEPAAGATQSSGGNFAGDEGEIQPAFDIGDLLPFTELQFPEEPEEEILPFGDDEPEVVIETVDNPIGVPNAVTTVDEDGLPARGDEPEGTQAETDSESTSGRIVVDALDGLSAILINGIELTGPGQVITTPLGELTITGLDLDAGEVTFTYTLTDNTTEDVSDVFQVTAIDTNEDSGEATLTINITDDGPIAADDFNMVPAGSHDAITGDVLINDVSGADGYAEDGPVQSFSNASGTAEPGETLQGEYGTLTLNADGSYTYVRDFNTPGGVEDTFEYTIADQDGSTSTATLVIEIGDAPGVITSVPRTGAGTVVEEGALAPRGDEPAGSGEIADGIADNNSDPAENTSGVIEFSSPDGLGSVTLNGVEVTPGDLPQTVIDDGTGTLVVTDLTYDPVTGLGSIIYEYTLGDNTDGDDTTVEVDIVVTDLDGDEAEDTLVITIVDDEPEAVDDDEGQVAEDTPVTVNVLDNDIVGADDVEVGDIAFVDGTLSGTGTLVNNGDGTFTYTPGPGEEGEVTFDYTITDGDGDTSTATVTLELEPDSVPEIAVEGDNTVDEAGLAARGDEPAGSDETSNSEFTSGLIAIDTGNDTVGSLEINGVDVTNGGTVTTSKGVLTVTLTGTQYSYTYELTDNTLTDPDSDTFTVTVTDSDGDAATTSFVIAIVDDAPTAEDDTGSIAAGEFGPIGGNVITNDTQGADGAVVTSYTGAGGSGDAGETVQGQYGVLTIAADGTFSYTRDPGTPGGVTDTFNYTITDGDGDTADADLVISIADGVTTLDLPVSGEAGTSVDEAGLDGPPAGSAAATDSETTAGTFTFSAEDGPATVLIDGTEVTTVGQTFTGSFGTLEITAINAGSISYTYTLETNTSGDNTSDSFVVRVEDQDDDVSEGTLEIAIVDDVPTAIADFDSVTEDGPLIADGNVLTGSGGTDANATDGVADVQGADGASVTGVAAGTSTSEVTGQVGTPVMGTYGSLTIGADGAYSYELDNNNATVQGLNETENLTETFTYSITDGDGDVRTTTVTITINGADDPVVITGLDGQGSEQTLFENDLPDGTSSDPAALTQTGSFEVTSQDGLATLTVGGITVFDADNPVGFPVTIDDPIYGLLTITGVATTTDASGDVVSATVNYSYTLQDNSLLHTGGNDGSFTDSFAVVATDTDGSTSSDSLDITIVDDAPIATDNSNTVDEGASVTGNLLTDDNGDGVDAPGADGFGAAGAIVEITSVNDTITQTTVDASGNLVITTTLGVLTVDATTGEYTYQSTADATNVDVADVFTYTIIDADGDEAQAELTIDVVNAPGVVSDNDVNVNEAGLPGGSDPLSGSATDNGGQITVVGATGTLVFSLDGAIAGPGANEVQIDGIYGTIVLNTQTGAYTYTLDTPFTDAVDENGANVVNAAESFTYEVRDTNGALIGDGSIDVNITDDIPTATDQASINVAEDAAAPIGGNVLTDGVDDTPGADGATVTVITIDGTDYPVAQTATPTSVTTPNGVYTILPDGTWTFDPAANLDQENGPVDASFTYTLTDGDGDFDTAEQPILITDGADPSAGPDIILTVDDQNLPDGSTPGSVTSSDTIVFTEGSDDIASIAFGGIGGLNGGLDWVRVSDTQITGSDGGRLVVTLDLSVTGTTATVTATLNDNFDDHPTINADDLADLGDVDVVATDIDGSTASSTVNLLISDDLPTITASAPSAGALTVDETVLGTDAMANFAGLFTSDANADGPGTVGNYTLGVNAGSTGLVDTATNEAVVLTVNNGVVEGRTESTGALVFTVSVDAATGVVTLDQRSAVKHVNTTDDNDPTGLAADNLITLSATITDSDGDTATATANIAGGITFLDDGPALSGVSVGSTVSVDETDGLTTSATSAASILNFTADFGEDGPNGTEFALVIDNAASGLATAVGDYPITLVATSPTVITGVFDDGNGEQPAFTVEINANGTITLTQIVALEHLVDGDDSAGEHNDTLDLAGKISATVTIKDGDGDTDSATVAIGAALTFFDDGPSVTLSGVNDSLTVSDADFGDDADANFADNFTFDGGEDGAASTSFALSVINGSDSGLIDTLSGNSVFLFLEAGVVVGREGVDAAAAATGEEVFTVTVDNTGEVVLDQSRAVDHELSTGANGSIVSLASDGLVQLIATVTDNDDDTASTALDIGSNLSFTDDVPTAGPNNVVRVDDDVLGGNPGGPNDNVDAQFTTGTLNHDFGNDGGTIAFETTGSPNGFRYVASGDDIIVEQEQGTGNFVAVLTITLDPSNGDYTVTQTANIWHFPGDTENNLLFPIAYTVTDGDTDTATGSLVINVDDDTPVATDDGIIATVDDNDSGVNIGNVTDITANDSYGADGVGTPAVTIAVGSLGGTVTIDGSGNLLYTSATDITAPFTDQVETFTYTITDGDGDTTTATFQVRITDEGPSIDADAATVTVDEEGLGGIAGNGDSSGDVAGEATVQTGNLSGIDFGTDGPGSITLTAVTDTGLTTLAGNAVETVWDATTRTLTGQDAVTGEDVFTLVINDVATGAYTFTLLAPINHPDGTSEDDQSFSVGVIVSDAEGDTANGSISITIDDDSPLAAIDASGLSVSHDETPGIDGEAQDVAGPIAAFAVVTNTGDDPDVAGTVIGYAQDINGLAFTGTNFGADGPGTVSFSLDVSSAGVESGLNTTDGTDIVLFKEGDVVVGRVGDQSGKAAFAVAVNSATGAVSLVQYLSIEHPTGGASSPDETVSIASGALVASVTATDADGDSSTASTAIGGLISFQDDAPTLIAPIDDETAANDADAAPLTGSLNIDFGADGPGTVETISADVTGLTVGGQPLTTVQNGNVLTAFVDSDGSGTFNAGDTEVFTITVDPDAGSSGEYEFDLIVPLDGEVTVVDIGSDGAFGSGPALSRIVSQDSTGDELVFVTGWEPNGNGGLLTPAELAAWKAGGIPDLDQVAGVNGSNAGFGINSNNFDQGQFMRFDLGALDDYDGPGDYSPPGGTNLLNATFISFSMKNFGQGDNVEYVAHFTDGTTQSITKVGSGNNSTETVTITAPPGEFVAFVDVYSVSGAVKLNIAEVGATETNVDFDLPVSVTLADGDGDTVSDDFVINIVDDAPDAQDDLTTTTVVDQDINAAFVLDFSGSLNSNELNLQLEAVKDAAFQLFENTTGDVTLTLVTFSGDQTGVADAIAQGNFTDFASFAQALDGLNNQLGGDRVQDAFTNFSAGIDLTIDEFGAVIAANPDANNQVFFLSDGNPNRDTGTNNALSDTVAADWQAFVNANDVNVTSVGVGGGISVGPLQDIDVDGEGAPVLAADFADLVDTLIEVVVPEISGNVLSNDTPAANGIEVTAIVVNGVTFAFDGMGTITPSSGGSISGTSFTATTVFGGELTFDFADGSFTYQPPQTSVAEVENFQYFVTDNDGDIDSAILRIDIEAVSENNNLTRNDTVITNAGSPVTIDQAWLQANDDPSTSITGIGTVTDATGVALSGGDVIFTDNDSDGGSFVYTSNADNAFVTVNRAQSGQNQLDGTSEDDILIGRSSNDTLVGGDGADILVGNGGSDQFFLRDGDSFAVVGGSGDAGTVSGFDVIVDFDLANDRLNFDGLTVQAAQGASFDGTDSTLTINGATIKSHSVVDGIISFDDSDTFSNALTLSSESDVAAVVDYLQNNDIGNNNSVVAFAVGSDTFVYYQDNATATPTQDSLVQLQGVTVTNFNTLISGTTIDPVVLDLDGDGTEFLGLEAGVSYDFDGDGAAEATSWVGADDAILAFDANGDGKVTDASEFVFGGNGVTDLEAIAARFDTNQDGVLDGSDDAFAEFGIWQDADSDGVADEGEFTSLLDAGITSIGLVSDGNESSAHDGDVFIHGKSAFTFANGQQGEVADTTFVAERQSRTQEHALAAAAASAVLVTTEYSVERDPIEAVDLASFEGLETVDPVPTVTNQASDTSVDSEELLAAPDASDDAAPSDNAMRSNEDGAEGGSNDLAINADQASVEPTELTSGSNDTAVFNFAETGDSSGTVQIDQAMEALLAMEANAEVAGGDDGSGEGLEEGAEAVFADMAIEAEFESLIDELTEDSDAAGYLAAETGAVNGELLDQVVESSITSMKPMAMPDSHADEAAANAVPA
ncbi:DUF5801 repeats-in-toxin domain-containing protein [Erythrobacter rubeus]|uniref:Cadherin-like domain-containing protein n=1 Tax=Erythrobacter rubeus TaxID=2760803 RepID=A0ABR8KRX8_9SPHN|nr:DUF5801 repeats-in-toxin domain-containing protein [Erythrobacter rubeus]MBD2841204.1 cadherin-like domain-containing protein [Erythrobacter rubeus]